MKRLLWLVVVLGMFVTANTGLTGTALAASSSSSQEAVLAEKIDINTADIAALSTLPGIGEKTAEAITSYRQEHGKFASIEDLKSVKGIGEKKLARIRPHLKTI